MCVGKTNSKDSTFLEYPITLQIDSADKLKLLIIALKIV